MVFIDAGECRVGMNECVIHNVLCVSIYTFLNYQTVLLRQKKHELLSLVSRDAQERYYVQEVLTYTLQHLTDRVLGMRGLSFSAFYWI